MRAVRTSNTSVDRWVSALQPRPSARIRLLCFPHAGGGASVFRRWCDFLPPDIDPCLIQLPGRENRLNEALLSDLSTLLEALVEALDPVLRPPFAMFGCSMGALVAFELARALRARGGPSPAHLLVAARQAPHLTTCDGAIHDLPDAELLEEISRLNGTPGEVFRHSELMQLMLPAMRADLRVCETYRYEHQPPLSCPLSAFAGSADPAAPPDAVSAWRAQTTSRFLLHVIEGGHFVVQTAPAALATRVAADLMRTVRGTQG